MKAPLIVSCLLFILVSCGDSTGNETPTIDNGSDSSETTSIQEPIEFIDTLPGMPAEISERVSRTLNFPFLLNQDVINNLDLSDNKLSQEEVELLSQYLMIKPGFSDIESRLASYFYYNQLIDSIGEEAYNNQIDLGMTQYFDAYLHYRVNLTKKKYLFVYYFCS